MSSSMHDLLPRDEVDLASTFGALFVGVIISAILFGANNVQAIIYFRMNKDRGLTLYKLSVIWHWILDTMHLTLIIHAIYYYLVTSYSNIDALSYLVWSFKLQLIPNTLIVYGVHVLYAYRLWIVSRGRSRVLPILVVIALILTSGVSIIFIWAAYRVQAFTDLAALDWAIYLTLSTMAFNDLIIASSLCYFLTTSRTGFSSTDSLLTKIMIYIINTGTLTSITSMIAILTCALIPNTFTYIAVQFLLAKLYVASFLTLLNMRYYLRSGYSDTADISQINHLSLLRAASRKSGAEQLEESRKLSQHSHENDELYPARPDQALTSKPWRPMTTIEMNSFSA